jgi:hypothetical protein
MINNNAINKNSHHPKHASGNLESIKHAMDYFNENKSD